MTLKPGDRVAVYNVEGRHVGRLEYQDQHGIWKVTLMDVAPHCDEYYAHPKQMRRLTKRGRREWTLEECLSGDDDPGAWASGPSLRPGETVRVREIKK